MHSANEHIHAEYRNFTIIIPTLNEAGNIAQLLHELRSGYPALSILVVDDQSSDGTQELVRNYGKDLSSRVQLLERKDQQDRGITASVLDGLGNCQTQYFIVMDGDFQHPPSLIAQIAAQLTAGSDLVIACRGSLPPDFSWMRRRGSQLATVAAQRVLQTQGICVSDPLSGCFGGRTSEVAAIVGRYKHCFVRRGYKILFDLLKVLAADSAVGNPKLFLTEVNYHFSNRSIGSSKFRPVHAVRFFFSLFGRCQGLNR